MTKKDIIRALILSPYYLRLKLKERSRLVNRLAQKRT